MDHIDHLLQDRENADLGIQLQERPEIHPAFFAGNKLSEALDSAEYHLGRERTANYLQAWLDGATVVWTHPKAAELQKALIQFSANVETSDMRTRLSARIARLRS